MSAGHVGVVPVELDGVRADKVVAHVFSLSRNAARAAIDAGGVWVADHAVTPSERLAAGTEITAHIPDAAPAMEPAPVPFAVAYIDEDVVVVDKPAGVVVHPGAGTTSPTLVAGLAYRFPELADLEARRWGLVHRLDRDTSGLLIVARTSASFDRLQAELKARRISRTYVTLVEGTPDSVRGTVDAPLGRDPHHPTRMAVLRDGRPARTHYRRLASWSGVALIEVQLETGRTHQIRVHLASIDHPVVGDAAYGGRRRRQVGDPGRQWLHAARLEFAHPTHGGVTVVASPPVADLRASLERLGEPVVGAVPDWEDLLGHTTRSPDSP